jgi:CDP-glycerol glycerophosphotransferase
LVASPPFAPAVSVVVIVYNDAARLGDAVRSVLGQSLRATECIIVDDHSTDATPQVAATLAAAAPDRVRVVRLPENSGACGRPRNAGMDHARAEYLMFLDSDDVLDRHAARNMLDAAERTGADLVVGRTIRHDLDRDVETSWMPWLVARQAVYESLREQPDLLWDVLSTNKLYRREFLTRERLTFTEGRFYEDNLFTAHAYLTAKKIAVIPQRVYRWNVVQNTSSPSVTNRPGELRNLLDRIAINRGIDALLAQHGTPELKLRKDVRFIGHDLRTHLSGLSRMSPDIARTLVDAAADYLAELNPDALREAAPLAAIAAYLVIQRDYDGVASVLDYLVVRDQRPLLTAELVERDGRVYWCDRHLDDPLGREILDVTDLSLHDRPMNRVRPGARITGFSRDGGTATITGDIANPLGRITPRAKLRANLILNVRGGHRRFSIPVAIEAKPTRLTWRATFDPARLVHPLGVVDPVYSVRLHVVADGESAELVVLAHPETVDAIQLPVRPRLGPFAGDVLQAYVTAGGNIALLLTARGRTARAGSAAVRRVRSTAVGDRTWRAVRGLQRDVRTRLAKRQTKLDVYHHVMTKLPVKKRSVVFESHMGKQYSDSPRAIYEALRQADLGYRPIWSYASHPAGFPADARLVKRDSWGYYLALARARFWVDNQGFPLDLRKRRQTTYIQTWHGSAFKRMGFDEAAVNAQTQAWQERLQRAIDRFDVFLIRSEHDRETLARGMRVHGELLEVGYPRNDALITGANAAEVAELRSRLQLDDGRQVVLYAPTFRPKTTGRGAEPLNLPWLEEFVERYGDRMVLLVRPHYLATFGLPPALRHAVRNVADVHDITPLYQLSDALVTDYSSAMFDYALLHRPMIFHVPDHDDYVRSRGAYFDLAEWAPGPLTHTDDELLAALGDLPALQSRYADRQRAFTERFGAYDRGNAAQSVVDRYFRPGARRG